MGGDPGGEEEFLEVSERYLGPDEAPDADGEQKNSLTDLAFLLYNYPLPDTWRRYCYALKSQLTAGKPLVE